MRDSERPALALPRFDALPLSARYDLSWVFFVPAERGLVSTTPYPAVPGLESLCLSSPALFFSSPNCSIRRLLLLLLPLSLSRTRAVSTSHRPACFLVPPQLLLPSSLLITSFIHLLDFIRTVHLVPWSHRHSFRDSRDSLSAQEKPSLFGLFLETFRQPVLSNSIPPIRHSLLPSSTGQNLNSALPPISPLHQTLALRSSKSLCLLVTMCME